MAKWSLYAIGLGATIVATIVVAFAIQARLRLPELRSWHRIALKSEFRAGRSDAPTSFPDYLRLEDRLFAELRARVIDDPSAADGQMLSRYNPKSIPAHLALDTPYNRSYELVPTEPRGSVLLVHGLSDSPYSMRGIAEEFYAQGFYVLVLRLPGHGTTPAALRDVRWEDWYAAVALAAKHAAAAAGPGKPFLAGGHSTGAALVTLYAVRALADPSLPRPERLYLVSAAIGISHFAVLTNVIAGLSFIPSFEKSAWIDVLPEYDPYKYNSFPVNAANQIYKLTRVLASAIHEAGDEGRLSRMPRLLVFQSIVDATVTAREVVAGLLALLPPGGHELVVFDVNRRERLQGLIAPGPMEDLETLKAATDLPFRLTLIGNRAEGSVEIAAYTREAGAREVTVENLPLSWPPGVISLGHVALPIPPDDPVYGLAPTTGAQPEYHLGVAAPRGESGALLVPLGNFTRLRSNPFFEVIREKIVRTL
jgi:alpha-beta hydrolase superfamily lysophospholipase